MKRVLIRLICAAAIIAAVAALTLYSQQLLRPLNTDIAYQQSQVFHSLPKNSTDVLIYGSSHAWRGVNTQEMFDSYGVNAYNYGCFCQHINTTYLYFRDSLRTQKPKVILLETYLIHKLVKDKDLNGEIYYTRFLPMTSYKRSYLAECFGADEEKLAEQLLTDDTIRMRYLSYFFPFTMYHSKWNEITEESFTDALLGEDLSKTRGYHNVEAHRGMQTYKAEIPDYREVEQKSLPRKARNILDDIVKRCRKKGIRIIFFTSLYEGENPYREAIDFYAWEKDCAYIDFFEKMEEAGLDPETDLYDSGHLNDQGARKQARYLAQYIREHYDIP